MKDAAKRLKDKIATERPQDIDDEDYSMTVQLLELL